MAVNAIAPAASKSGTPRIKILLRFFGLAIISYLYRHISTDFVSIPIEIKAPNEGLTLLQFESLGRLCSGSASSPAVEGRRPAWRPAVRKYSAAFGLLFRRARCPAPRQARRLPLRQTVVAGSMFFGQDPVTV